MRWGATHGLRSLVEDLAKELSVERREVTDLAELDAATVVLAMPDPQARRLVGDHPVAERAGPGVGAGARARRPLARLGRGTSTAPSSTTTATSAWIADDGRRRGDDAPVLVAHSTPALAARHLDDPGGAAPAMVEAVRRSLGVGEPDEVHVHRWTFARPTGEREASYALVDGDPLVGVCGDGWGPRPKVETAWVSGTSLGQALAQRLSAAGTPST